MDTIEVKKRAVYEWVDEHRPDLWDRPLTSVADPKLTKELVSTLVRVATKAGGTKTRDRDVRGWLVDTRRHSPYLDEIALERAMRFDWPVIEQLTTPERHEFARRLMDSPHLGFDNLVAGSSRVDPGHPFYPEYQRGTTEQRALLGNILRHEVRRRLDLDTPLAA